MDARQMYEKWLRDFAQDPDLVRELTAIAGDDKTAEPAGEINKKK